MADEPQPFSPLEYQSRGTRGPAAQRGVVVVIVGAFIALVGAIVFFCSEAITAPPRGQAYSMDHRLLQEQLWGAFGIAVLLAGTIIAAVGLASWCRGDAK
jgi:hypothetical protein